MSSSPLLLLCQVKKNQNECSNRNCNQKFSNQRRMRTLVESVDLKWLKLVITHEISLIALGGFGIFKERRVQVKIRIFSSVPHQQSRVYHFAASNGEFSIVLVSFVRCLWWTFDFFPLFFLVLCNEFHVNSIRSRDHSVETMRTCAAVDEKRTRKIVETINTGENE